VLVTLVVGSHYGRKDGVSWEHAVNVTLWIMVVAALGARGLHLMAVGGGGASLSGGSSGFAFYGGLAGSLLALAGYARVKKLPIGVMLDGFAIGISLGMIPGRAACLLAGCCFGRPIEAPLPDFLAGWMSSWPQSLSLVFTHADSVAPLHTHLVPTQALMALSGLVLFPVLAFVVRPRRRWGGQICAWYLILYGPFRFTWELFRDDSRGFMGPLSTSQIGSLVAVALGLLALRYFGSRDPLPPTSVPAG